MSTSTPIPETRPDFDFLTSDSETLPEAEDHEAMPRRSRAKWLLLACLLMVLIVGVIWWRGRSARGEHPRVRTAVVTRDTVRYTVSATGTLQAFTTVDVKSKASGAVLQLAVEEGTLVKKGQLIAVIDRQDTSAAYRQALADVKNAAADLKKAQDTAKQQSENLGPQTVQSQSGVASAAARLDQAQKSFALQTVTTPADISQAQQSVLASLAKLEQSRQALVIEQKSREAAVGEARDGVSTARARLNQAVVQAKTQPSLSQSSVESAQASVDAAHATLQSAQENLNQLQNATQPQDRAQTVAQVNEARSNLKTAELALTRQKTLFDQGFVAQSTVETAQNQADTSQAALATAQARLDTLDTQQSAALRQSQAQVNAARSNLQQAQANLKAAQANTIQNALKTNDVTAAQAALRQAESTLNTAQVNLRQITVKQGDVQSAVAALSQAKSTLGTARANASQIDIKKADVSAAFAALRQSEAALQSTRNSRLGVAASQQDVVSARAQWERAQITAQNAAQNLQQTRVVAPRDGIVLQKYVDVGAIIQSGQSGFSGGTSIVQLAQVNRMFVDVLVDEADISQVSPGQKVTITLDAYPKSPKVGTVRKIYPLASVTQNVTYIHVQVELNPADVDRNLRPAMNATCDFLVQERKNVLAVPNSAVKDDAGTSYVTVVKDPHTPAWVESNQEKRTVTVGVTGNDNVEILSGLKEGERVITQIIQPTVAATPANGTRSLTGGPGSGGGRRGR